MPMHPRKLAPLFALATVLFTLSAIVLSFEFSTTTAEAVSNAEHLGPMAWKSAQWEQSCDGVRTSYNEERDLSDEELTLVPGDERWLDFVYWTFNNKIAEHQVEAYGGTDWDGPAGGVIFHWAPGSHWERDTLASFGFTIGHVIGEHRWVDTMFPDFFERFGGVYGVNVKDRLVEIDAESATPWVEFLEYAGSSSSPYYRYLFHQEAVVDPTAERIDLLGGQGVAFSYSFARYYHELREVLTDCRAVDFFRMYDLFGHGFAASGNWARQNPPPTTLRAVGYVAADAPAVASDRYVPNPPGVPVPRDLPEAEAMRRGQIVYSAQCAPCHGVAGDGKGFLAAGFAVPPRDFTSGTYKFRSTATGELPTIEDLERSVRVGIPDTTMPAWGQFLTAEQIADVSRYLVVFSDRFTEAWRQKEVPAPIGAATEPTDLASYADAGARLYEDLGCASCHGDDGRGAPPNAEAQHDQWGHEVRAADLTYRWTFRNGHTPEDVRRTLIGGLNGSPMPSYSETMESDEQVWALVAHVLSLSPAKRPVIRLADFAVERRSRIGPDGHVVPRTD